MQIPKILFLGAWLCMQCLTTSVAAADDNLAAVFENPPALAHPKVWWHWINGNITKAGIRADLEDMKRVGIAGAQILDVEIYLPAGPVRYGSDAWHEHVQYAIKTAAELGLEIDIANSPGWSGSGGPWITPERSMKQLVWSEIPAEGGSVSLTLPQPQAKLNFYRDIAVIAVPPTTERLDKLPAKIGWSFKPVTRAVDQALPGIPRDKVINLTGKMDASGKLQASLPPGKWVVLRFGFSSTGAQNHPAQPEGHGLEADKLDVATVAFEFEQSMGRVIRDAGPLAGKTLKGILFDSFEAGFQNWSANFPAEFSQRKGYDFIPFLPLMTGRIIQSQEASEAVLWDFRGVIDDLFAENYFGTMHRLAAAHGMQIYSESQGGPLNPMSANRYVDVPMNEFWMPDSASRGTRIKMSTSAAGYLGLNVIAAEAFTATPANGKYQAIPSTLKNPGDYAFTLGINRFIFHHYTHQPVTEAAPGFALGRYGTHFGRLNTWWPFADAWISYLSRSQALLQEGRTVADVCVLADEDMGYGFPSKIGTLMPGYDYNVCSPADLRAMSVREGRVVHPQGQSYGVVILPDSWVSELSTLRHLQRLVNDGAVIAGNAPVAPAGLHDIDARQEFDTIVKSLWGGLDGKKAVSKKMGNGMVCLNMKPLDALKAAKITPDVSWAPVDRDFRFIHRATPGADLYFVFNHSETSVTTNLGFRQNGREPEIWDSVTGAHAPAPLFSSASGTVSVPVQLEPWGSAFIVFRKPLPKRWAVAAEPADMELRDGELLSQAPSVALSYSDGGKQTVSLPAHPADQTIAGPWQVAFTDGRGAPAQTVFEKLISWSDHPEQNIKYYSGIAIYETTFQALAPKPGQAAILDLGTVADLAKVTVNGKPAGVLWKTPFRADIAPLLHEGANTLQVAVANRWINRLIGDESIPVDYTYQEAGNSKFTDGKLLNLPGWLYDLSKKQPGGRHSFTSWHYFDAKTPLVPSGLIGPVKLEWFNKLPTPTAGQK
ncbi:MAG: glycosyl hydrolase [Chthoniobacteraceae bacterium]